MANNSHVVTGKVRLSYCNLFTPQKQSADPNAKEKYSCVVLLPKSDTATKAKIDAAIEAAKLKGQSDKWGGKIPAVVPTPLHDGDGTRPSDGEPYSAECKGCWVFSASSTVRPNVVDANVDPIMDQSEIYSGIYARVAVDFFPYNFGGKKGVGCSLGNVQKVGDGEHFGGGSVSAADDFGAPSAKDPFAL